jgi:type I restriction enzyme S subunit
MPSKYKVYSEYRESELKWLGKVPSHWEVSKFGYVKTVLTDYTANGSFADLKKNVDYRDEPSYARLVRLTDLRVDLENQNGVWIDEDAYHYLRKSALFGGEFLLANVGAYAGLFYQMPENKGNASLAPNMFMAKFDVHKTLREFMAYVGQSQSVNEQLKLNATASSAQPKLNKDDFKSVRFTYPPIEEQEKIANFLDYETAKIDTLIGKQQQLIKLLKEKRQAVISHAVTKGLNPDAPRRDSGVEWLEEVPEHWNIKKFTHCTSIRNGLVDPTKSPYCDFTLIAPNHIESGTGRLIAEETAADQGADSGKYLCKQGEVIYSKIRPALAKVCISRSDNTICSADMYPIQGIYGLTNEFLYWSMLSTWFTSLVILESDRVAMPKINREKLAEVMLPVPPLQEQIEINIEIGYKTKAMDNLIQKAAKAITLAQERRTALISAAVTGKIDVRNWVAPVSSDNNKEVA